MTDEELHKQILQLLTNHIPEYDEVDLSVLEYQIHNCYKQANYVRLSDDQSLPEFPTCIASTPTIEQLGNIVNRARQDMLKAGFRKVELQSESDK